MNTFKSVLAGVTAVAAFLGYIEVDAAPPPKEFPVTITNTPDNPVPIRPVTSVPRIPFEYLHFTRSYCGKWQNRIYGEVDEARHLRAVTYIGRIPVIHFDGAVFWDVDIFGELMGSHEYLIESRSGNMSASSRCSDGSLIEHEEPLRAHLHTYLDTEGITRATNLLDIDGGARGWTCDYNGDFPVNIEVRVHIVEHTDTSVFDSGGIRGEEGRGQICATIQSIEPR